MAFLVIRSTMVVVAMVLALASPVWAQGGDQATWSRGPAIARDQAAAQDPASTLRTLAEGVGQDRRATVTDAGPAGANTTEPTAESRDSTGVQIAKFLGGAATGLGVHELGHILAGASVGAKLRIKKVEFKGLPFFAITHMANLSRRQEFAVASAGFWAQYAASELILSTNPNIRSERRRFREGVLAFHVGTSIMYAGAAFAKAGPYERDTRAMAQSLGISERWVGVLVLVPALLDTYRYFHPEAQWAAWASRGAKVGMVVLTIK